MKKYKLPKLNIDKIGRIFLTTHCVKELEVDTNSYMSISVLDQQPYLVLSDKAMPDSRYLSIYMRGKYSRTCSKKMRKRLEAIYADLSDYSFLLDVDAKKRINGQIYYPMERVD